LQPKDKSEWQIVGRLVRYTVPRIVERNRKGNLKVYCVGENREQAETFLSYAKALAKELIEKDISVSFFKQFENPSVAEYGHSALSFNISRLGYAWFKQGRTPEVTATIVHELAHEAKDPDYAHGQVYVNRLANLAGKLPFLATKKPELFT
jgi:hypothetical protein